MSAPEEHGLAGQVAIVTGGGSSIGLAIARRLAADGAKIVIGDIEKAEEAAAGLHHAPFCSKRCADVDLNRWLSGTYAVPVTEAEDEDGAPKLDAPGEEGR